MAVSAQDNRVLLNEDDLTYIVGFLVFMHKALTLNVAWGLES